MEVLDSLNIYISLIVHLGAVGAILSINMPEHKELYFQLVLLPCLEVGGAFSFQSQFSWSLGWGGGGRMAQIIQGS